MLGPQVHVLPPLLWSVMSAFTSWNNIVRMSNVSAKMRRFIVSMSETDQVLDRISLYGHFHDVAIKNLIVMIKNLIDQVIDHQTLVCPIDITQMKRYASPFSHRGEGPNFRLVLTLDFSCYWGMWCINIASPMKSRSDLTIREVWSVAVYPALTLHLSRIII